MKPLNSVCALRIWKISSCLRIPVAPATARSFAICVSFWMLMSFRSVMFRRCCGPAAGCGGCGCAAGGDAGFGGSGVALAVGVGVAASGAVAPLPVRPGPGRFVVLGMGILEDQVGDDVRLTVYTDFRRSQRCCRRRWAGC